MGYTTEFEGTFQINPTLKEEHNLYLTKFAETRRMKRDSKKCENFEDPIRLAVDLPIGVEGEYTVFGTGFYGQNNDISIIDYNEPSSTQPELWCRWVPNESGTELAWDGTEKFHAYIEWLNYLHSNFLEPWGYTLSGSVSWKGEDLDDTGVITFNENILSSMSDREIRKLSNINLKKKD
jgi:hypothetical protein